MVRDKSLTPAGIVATRRRTSQGLQGLAQVETHNPGYLPPTELSEWLEREKLFFLAANMDPALVPKGLVLDGPAGVGKTEAAKWIAYMLGLPLYRIDLGTTKNMWVGQSEANLSAILSRLDREEPCVALFDEIEKMVSEDSSGVGASMLSQLLWWFAESPSRVLRIMTTNDLKRVPAELYRPGRIDKVMNFGGLKGEAAVLKFANHVMAQFPPKLRVPPPAMAAALKALLMIGETPVSQATVTQAVKVIVKQNAIQTKLIAAA
jgi:SpoVK/Ycf46/Vps4 family AAA+-type ATPase